MRLDFFRKRYRILVLQPLQLEKSLTKLELQLTFAVMKTGVINFLFGSLVKQKGHVALLKIMFKILKIWGFFGVQIQQLG
jgi:hypothetical protein